MSDELDRAAKLLEDNDFLVVRPEDFKGTCSVSKGDAVYVMVLVRDEEADYIPDRTNDKAGIRQVHGEMQFAYDQAGTGGMFRVLLRKFQGKITRTDDLTWGEGCDKP